MLCSSSPCRRRVNATWDTVPPTASCLDAWQIGCLLRETFGGVIASPKELTEMSTIPEVRRGGVVLVVALTLGQKLKSAYQRLLNKSPQKRLRPKVLLDVRLPRPQPTDALCLRCSVRSLPTSTSRRVYSWKI